MRLNPREHEIAPRWHTATLIVLLLAVSFLSSNSQHAFTIRHGPVLLYCATIAWEWLLVVYIAFGIRRRNLKLRDLVGGRGSSLRNVLADVGLGLIFWILALAVLAGVASALGLARTDQMAEARRELGFLIPHGRLETTVFLALCASAGFCEEIIFRGYFQRQFAAFTGSALGGLALQAVLFGAGHAYEGSSRMFLIVIYGVMFGVLAKARSSLRPGMWAHFFHDASAGIALQRIMR